ncbi:hypothetical protein [Prescottella agglutinans]|uniref:Lipoprotein n=1 Tax=Prescottella agglutinans TaxID=1644129 RepID=A0ABT6MJ40_9NOCA|nr:hypothetical protein [Prescottella agglutinans]MDH6284310.1 hypothetical protein [Prescottella agglutinans]
MTGPQQNPGQRSDRRPARSSRLRAKGAIRAVSLGLVAALSVVGLAACGSSSNGPPSEIVIDSSATKLEPKKVELDGLMGEFYYSTSDIVSGPGRNRPVLMWTLTNTADGVPKSFRAKVEVRQDGRPVDAYFAFGKQGHAKNEWIANDVELETSSGLIANKTGPRHDGRSDDLASDTGTDFEFTLSNIEVADTQFTPTELVRPAAPVFTNTPDDQFNKLAYEKRWTVSDRFKGPSTSSSDPIRLPATAMRSFIKQINEWGSSGVASSSPTQMFSEWMTSWNPEMLAAGLDMLGDDQIKETYRRVLAGDIDRWFGNGTHVVGTGPNQIPPGTYQVTAKPGSLIKDGYWERTSTSGDIIDNNFISSAQQVTVTIAATDGQFTSKKMGTWKPVG